MSKYNKFSRPPPGDTSMRFNKRPRYGANNSLRFSQQNQSYNYPTNRNSISSSSGSYQLNNQYEQNARNYYVRGSSKSATLKHQKQNIKSSTYSSYIHSPQNSTSISSPTTIPNSGKQSNQSTTPQSAPSAKQATQNVTGAIPENALACNNYFYPNYTDITGVAPSYCLTDTISPYMWHTIKSTPPPNIIHQPPLPPPQQITQPPLPGADILPQLHQPPLPGADILTQLHQPPPPISSCTASTAPCPTTDQSDNANRKASGPFVKMKVKRKAMSARYDLSKSRSQEDVQLALKTEVEYMSKQQKDIILILRFPDPEINRDIVKTYHSSIESVHFQLNFAPRYCFAHLKPGTDVEKTIEDISKIPFGNGFITAEIKSMPTKPNATTEIDPCTLYVGNIPMTLPSKVLKDHFYGSVRIDIGFAQRMKYTRYAFVRYEKVEHAIEAYKRMLNTELGGRSLILRFRRIAAIKEDQKESAENCDDLQEDEELMADLNVLNETTSVSQNKNDNTDTIGGLQNTIQTKTNTHNDTTIKSKNNTLKDSLSTIESANLNKITASETQLEQDHTESISEVATDTSKPAEEADKYPDNESNQSNTITNDSISTDIINNRMSSISSDVTQVSSDSSLPVFGRNIKTDPEIDPEDRVVRDEAIISRCDFYKDNIKQEHEVDTDFEFFATVDDDDDLSNNNTENLSIDDSDTTVNSGSSLGEFLRTCQSSTKIEEDTTGLSPTAKRRKIKKEPMESITKKTTDDLLNPIEKSIVAEAIKQEDLNNISTNENISNVDNLSVDNRPQSMRKRSETLGKNIKEVRNNLPTVANDLRNSKSDKLPQCRSSEIERPTTSQNLRIDNDDIVPPSPFLGKRYQNLTKELSDKLNKLNNYEFFDTTNKTLNEDLIKGEPLDIPLNTNNNEKNILSPQKANTTKNLGNSQSPKNETTKISQSKPNLSKTSMNIDTTFLDFCPDDNDLVPLTNNLLGSRQSVQIKQEEDEHDDIFSVPFVENTSANKNKDKDFNDLRKHSGTCLNINLNNNFKTTEVSTKDKTPSKDTEYSNQHSSKVSEKVKGSDSAISDDDDIIVVSEYFPPRETSTEFLTERRVNIYGGELVRFEPTPTPTTTENHNFSSLFSTINDRYSICSDRYKLDRLYDELEDLENEL